MPEITKTEAREQFVRDVVNDFEKKWTEHEKDQKRQTQKTEKKEKLPLTGEGQDILKELPLSKFEWPLIIMMTGAAIIMVFLDRIGLVNELAGTAVIILLIYAWGLYLVKRWWFTPTGNKVIVMRAYKNSGIKLSVEKIKHDRLIHFDKDDDVPPCSVERFNKHFEISTGRPFIIAMEERSKNISLNKEYEQEKEAKEFSNIVKTTFGTAWQSCLNNMLKFRNKVKDPMFIITVLVLFGIMALIVIQLASMNQTSQALEAIAKAVGVTAEAA